MSNTENNLTSTGEQTTVPSHVQPTPLGKEYHLRMSFTQ
jgi:hypothetical protein